MRLLKILSLLCVLATIVLAILWYFNPAGNYEPITVALGGVSAVLIAVSQVVQRKRSSRTRANKADIRLEVVEADFVPSPGRGVSSYRGGYREAQKRQRESPAGFDKQGLPNEGHLHASIEITNVGREIGVLEWEYDEAKTKLPPLFDYDHEETLIDFFPPRSIAGRNPPHIAHFDLYVPFTEHNRWAFAQAVKALIESNARYKIVIRYWTKGVEGKSESRELSIEGNFQGFYQKVLECWDDFSRFRDLADLARLTKS